jgi:uncharacterized protein (TIGR00290 family)
MSWSSGKDSALALHHALRGGEVEVTGLLTTINAEFDRVAMHGVRRVLLEQQAAVLGLPLHVVELPWPCSNERYEQLMESAVSAAVEAGAEVMVFGDLYLADVRAYRERMLAGTGLRPLFPLWERPTCELAQELIASGVRAVVTCVDRAQAPAELAGRWYDDELLAALPATADCCGENGEFHTVVVDGPDFRARIPVNIGEIVERDCFVFADVVPAENGGQATEL